ncbi:MAG: TraB/GumN family protein [Desulfonatronovibrionaceae bacterium]
MSELLKPYKNMNQNSFLSNENVTRVRAGDKDIYLLGTAHVSQQSVEDVKSLAESIKPDAICVELCASRHQVMTQQDVWQKTDIYRVVRENKSLFLLVQLGLSTFYRKIGEKLGVRPGAEMLEGVRQAEKLGTELVLADRDVNITLKRVWGSLSFWSKLKLLGHLLLSLVYQGDIEKEDIEKIKSKDQLQIVMDEFAGSFPQVQKTLVDERDRYLAHKISTAPGIKILAVVGAAHVPGIKKYLHQDVDVARLTSIPDPPVWPVVLKWAIPAVIVLLLAVGFLTQGTEHSIQSVYIWVLVNGIFSALGVSLALGHPLAVAAAFVAAPITSLNPTIAAGWIAGLVQAWVKKPVVADLENLSQALSSLKGFWLNPVCRILLVVVLANLGSSLGTFVAGTWIVSRVF